MSKKLLDKIYNIQEIGTGDYVYTLCEALSVAVKCLMYDSPLRFDEEDVRCAQLNALEEIDKMLTPWSKIEEDQ